MWFHLYVAEKLRALDEERLARIDPTELEALRKQRPTALGRLTAIAGRSLRRFGEALELWATPAGEREHVRVALTRVRRPD
jgi:hypothetical protein